MTINRQTVYSKTNGHCGYCGKKISLPDMQVDHMKSKFMGGTDDIANLMPTCRRCNHYKRSLDVEGFRKYLATLHERIMQNYIVKVGVDYGIVVIKPFNGKFYFEEIASERRDEE